MAAVFYKLVVNIMNRKGLLAIADQAIVSAANFLAGFLLARFMSLSDYGAYTLAFAIMLTLLGLQLALMAEPMVVFGAPMDNEAFKAYFSSLIFLQLFLGLFFAAGVAAAAMAMRVINVSPPLVDALLALSPALFFIQYREFLRRALFTRMQAASVFHMDLVYACGFITSIFALQYLGSLSTPATILAMGGAAFASTALALYLMRDYIVFRSFHLKEVIRRNWAYGRWQMAISFSHFAYSQIEIFILAGFAGLAASGGMGATRNIVAPLQVLMFALGNIAAPRAAILFAKHGRAAMDRFLIKAGAILFTPCAIYCAIVLAVPHFLLSLFYQDKYADLTLTLRLWALVYLVISANQMLGIGLNSIRRPDLKLFALLLTLPMTLIVSFLAIPKFGIVGAMMAHLATNLVLLGFMTYYFFKPGIESAADVISQNLSDKYERQFSRN